MVTTLLESQERESMARQAKYAHEGQISVATIRFSCVIAAARLIRFFRLPGHSHGRVSYEIYSNQDHRWISQ